MLFPSCMPNQHRWDEQHEEHKCFRSKKDCEALSFLMRQNTSQEKTWAFYDVFLLWVYVVLQCLLELPKMALRDVVTRFIEKMASPPFTSHQPWYAGRSTGKTWEDMGRWEEVMPVSSSWMMQVSMICCWCSNKLRREPLRGWSSYWFQIL